MGTHHKDGYSAHVEGFLIAGEGRFRLAKSNEKAITLAESCELPPGTKGKIVVIVDDEVIERLVELPTGVSAGQTVVQYLVPVPF